MAASDPVDDQPSVLVVDDDPETADLYTESLRETYRVRTAYSGMEALDLLDSTIDVVLLDRRMPRMSGDEVLGAIRSQECDCRTILVTAVSPDLDIAALPFDEYLVKPVSRETLHDAVERMLVRSTHDATLQELMALASKMATLEAKLELSDLRASDEYAALEAQFSDLRNDLGEVDQEADLYPEFTTQKIRAIID